MSSDGAPVPLPRFDLLIRGGSVVDGTGAPSFRADVGVLGGRIAAVRDLTHAEATRVIDAAGRAVAPGFIDIHTHSDISVLYTPGMESSLLQGVTTEVVGNCGFSLCLAQPTDDFTLEQRGLSRAGLSIDWPDLGGFLGRIEGEGVAANVATLVGHGTVRKRVMGNADRRPDATELAAMRRELATALEQGGIGLSSGLEYVPGMYADVAELTELAKVAAEAGGFYATHLRDEGDGLEEAVAEAIAVAEGSGLPLQLSHHKAERPRNWGKVRRTLQMADAARARGLDVLLDQYPYVAYQTGLATVALPPWANAGTPEALAAKLRDPDLRERARDWMLESGVSYDGVVISTHPARPELQGRTIQELAQEAGSDPRDVILDLLSEGEGWVSAAHFALSEEDVEFVLRDPHVMVGSDAVAASPSSPFANDRTHPRTYGTFARVLGRYVRERGTLTLEEAVRRMTSLPASRLRLSDRGRIAEGCAADLVIFDPAAVADAATFDAPHAFPRGVEAVIVNGTLAALDGRPTGARAGRVLRHA
jgi:N-acyl-D-amino-acid deacylase